MPQCWISPFQQCRFCAFDLSTTRAEALVADVHVFRFPLPIWRVTFNFGEEINFLFSLPSSEHKNAAPLCSNGYDNKWCSDNITQTRIQPELYPPPSQQWWDQPVYLLSWKNVYSDTSNCVYSSPWLKMIQWVFALFVCVCVCVCVCRGEVAYTKLSRHYQCRHL